MSTKKIAIVTGASTGIGRAIAAELARKSSIVGLVARSVDGLNKTLSIIRKNGGEGEIFPTDLKSIKKIQNLSKKIKEQWGRVDILVNVAGVWHGKDKVYSDIDFMNYPIDAILETYNVGITAPTILSHELLPIMNKGSKIINISGTFESGAKGWLPYYVSKRAIEDLTVGLSEELKDKGIQVNCISPSDTATEAYKKYFPQYVKNAIDPEEIAKHVIYLCSKEAGNVSGEVFVVKKGKKPFRGFHS